MLVAVRGLSDEERARLESNFTPELRAALEKHRPTELSPAAVATTAEPGKSSVVSGEGTEGEERVVHSTIRMPLQIGDIATFTPLPVQAIYDVLTLRDVYSAGEPACVALVPDQWPPPGRAAFTGVPRESRAEDWRPTEDPPHLEAAFSL